MRAPGQRFAASGTSAPIAGVEVFGLRVMLLAIGFVLTVITSRALGPEGRGIYYVPVLASIVLMTIAKVGLEQSNIFLFGSGRVSLERLAAQNLMVAIGFGGAAALALIAAPVILPVIFADVPVVLLVLAGLSIPFAMHTQFTGGLQNLASQVSWQFGAAVIAGIAQIALLLGLVAFGAASVTSVLLVSLVAVVLQWALTVARSAGKFLRVRWDAQLLRDTLSHSALLHPGMLFLFLHFRIDMFMIKAIVGATALGQYSLAVVLAETLTVAPDSISMAILPAQVDTSLREAARVAVRAARLSAIAALVGGLGWALGGRLVIDVFFGLSFDPAFASLVLLLPAMVFLSVQRACSAAALRAGRPARFTAIYGATLICNVLLNLIWIPAFGEAGAAIASSVSYTASGLLFFVWVARLAELPLTDALRPRRDDFTALRRLIGLLAQRVIGHGRGAAA